VGAAMNETMAEVFCFGVDAHQRLPSYWADAARTSDRPSRALDFHLDRVAAPSIQLHSGLVQSALDLQVEHLPRGADEQRAEAQKLNAPIWSSPQDLAY
jgi:hypothetical protein